MSSPNYADTSYKGIKHRVPARNEGRILVRVDVIPQNGCDIGGQHVKQGAHEVIVYASELEDVQRLVRTDKAKADFARAEQVFANQIAALVKGLGDSLGDQAERKRRLDEYGESPYAILAVDPAYTGGFGKLHSCTVIDADVPAPPTLENIQSRQFGDLTDAILRGVAGGGSGGAGIPTPEQIDARIQAGIAAGLEALEKRIAEKYRAK